MLGLKNQLGINFYFDLVLDHFSTSYSLARRNASQQCFFRFPKRFMELNWAEYHIYWFFFKQYICYHKEIFREINLCVDLFWLMQIWPYLELIYFCREGSFNFAWTFFHRKTPVCEAGNFIKKRDSGISVFLWVLRSFKEHLFSQNTPTTDSGRLLFSFIFIF